MPRRRPLARREPFQRQKERPKARPKAQDVQKGRRRDQAFEKRAWRYTEWLRLLIRHSPRRCRRWFAFPTASNCECFLKACWSTTRSAVELASFCTRVNSLLLERTSLQLWFEHQDAHLADDAWLWGMGSHDLIHEGSHM